MDFTTMDITPLFLAQITTLPLPDPPVRSPDIVAVLLAQNGSLFTQILGACKPIAAIGIGSQLYHMLPKFNEIEELPNNINKLFWSLVLAIFLVQGDLGKNVALFNWGAIKSIDGAIARGVEGITELAKLTKDLQGDRYVMKDIESHINACSAIKATADDGGVNPAFTACQDGVKALIQNNLQAGKIQNPDLVTRLGNLIGSAASLDFSAFTSQFTQLAGNFSQGLAQVWMTVFFGGWKMGISFIGPIAILISILALPIPLCLSVFNPSPLMVWFSSFWAVGIYMFNFTIITKSFEFFTAKFNTNASVYFLDIGVCFFAPFLAGLMGAGGGIAVYKFCSDLVGETVKTVADSAIKLTKVFLL
jgi:hypothetical protein